MIKRLLAICLIIFFASQVNAQTFGNEWINYSQKYYKIKIAKNGVYRIDSLTLANAGIPLNTINPKKFQLFNNGIQQSIYVEGESDNTFNGSDFIEFYAQKNDGSLDSSLYVESDFIPNPYYSLINDTSVYFLTWNSSTSNKRFQLETDISFVSYVPDNYFFKDEVFEIHNGYYEGETDNAKGTDARYTKAEGWFDENVINLGGSASYNVNTSNVYSAGPNATIKSMVLGASRDNAFSLDHHLSITYNGLPFVDTLFKGYEANRFVKGVPAINLGVNTTPFVLTSVSDGFKSNRTVLSYINVKYPHTMDLEGKSNFLMYVPQNTIQSKSFLTLNNFNSSGTVHLYDLTNSKRIVVISNGSFDSVLISNSGAEKKCFITSDGNISSITALQPVNSTAQFVDYSTMAVDSAFVIVTHKLLRASADDYKSYRSTNVYGGGHNVIIADIDDLYDQFAFGIVKSPLSIRNFCKYLLNNYPTPPKNLFLIGKAYHMQEVRRNSSTYYSTDLVPSFGNPSSDHLLTAGLSGGNVAIAIPTGRLAAQSLSDVDVYLDKVEQYENRINNPPAEWMKDVLHFGGGKTSLEQDSFKGFLAGYESIIEDPLFGGQVSSYYKTSSSPIQINTSEEIKMKMNNGVSLMTFFGHTSGNNFDQSIDDINSYNPPPGHYPFMLANGCYSGDIHNTSKSTSENYVINSNKGTVGYLAVVGLGIPYALNFFSSEFYRQISLTNYGNSVGSSIKNSINLMDPGTINDPLMRSTCLEMTLHGDPALIINSHKKPDYKITNNDVSFDLTPPDAFLINIVRTNIGRATIDSIFTEVYRTFPDGSTESYVVSSLAPKFKDTISIKIPRNFSKDIGLNKVKVTVDFYNRVDEMDETNNTTNPDINFLINGGDVMPVYPYEFSIVPNDSIILKASTMDPFSLSRNYIFQIDTIDTYDSPLMESSGLINGSGGIISWEPSINYSANTVYYWRVSPDSTSAINDYSWRESSFQYIPNKRGWEQAHFFQFKNDGFQYVKSNRPLRRFDFVDDIKAVRCKDGIYPYLHPSDVRYEINASVKHKNTCTPNAGISFVVFDPYSGNPMQSVKLLNPALPPAGAPVQDLYYGQFGNRHCVDRNLEAFDFFTNETSYWRPAIKTFINSIPVGTTIMAYSQWNASIQMDTTLYKTFESFGVSGIRTITDNRPFIFFGKKGSAIGSAREIIGDSVSSIIQLDTTVKSNWSDGFISSPVIGPALSWDSLSWEQHSLDGAFTSDSIRVRVIGINNLGETTLANFTTAQLDIINFSSIANAAIYPKIRLVAYMKDDSLNSPPQLERWQVFYTPVPEAAINVSLGYFTEDSIQEGDNLLVHLPVQNISEYSFVDSLLVTYWLEDGNKVIHPLPDKLKKNLFKPNEVIIDTINVNTQAHPGNNALWVEVNPIDKPKSQLEQYHFNNIVRIPFNVSSDKINPLLDVTFDGVHILNNDIVSSKPNILIQLKDENQFLALNDTNDFKIFIQDPNLAVAQRVYFGSLMAFIPANLPNNSCKINYTPTLLKDGNYQLIVQAKDQSDNLSGAIDYKINFEIINKSTITEVMNYPNPFSTATHFVFTLTGAEVPTYFKIQILTITGKVVREITNDELGLVHIGRNITDYAWNGKDQFGDQLANGVYLYRVVTTLHGEKIEKRATEADQYFEKEFGKMFLMR